jgi:hypothetical protein
MHDVIVPAYFVLLKMRCDTTATARAVDAGNNF